MAEQDASLAQIVAAETSRLRAFVRRSVDNPADIEDIVQEVFYELVEAQRLLMPIDHISAWLYRVAHNRIIDLFRKKRPELFSDVEGEDEEGEPLGLEDALPSPDAGPEAASMRKLLLDELARAIAALPREQREVFIAQELEGRSFKELAAESGVNMSTLLSRKRYAVLNLRRRLQSIHDDFTNE